MSFRFLAEALSEFDNAANWYDQQRSGLGAEFVQAVDSAIQRLVVEPETWPMLDDQFRRCPVDNFPYDIVFVPQNKDVLIFAIAHHHQKPDFWRGRK